MPQILLRFLEPGDLTAYTPEGADAPRIVIKEDRTILGARVKRAFPMSDKDEYYSIQDGMNKEVGVLRSLDGLDPESRKIIEEMLNRHYFQPIISQIRSLKQDAGMWKFEVMTHRGPAEFYVRNWRDSAYELGIGRWQISSVDGLRFEIPDLNALDVKSQDLLDQIF